MYVEVYVAHHHILCMQYLFIMIFQIICYKTQDTLELFAICDAQIWSRTRIPDNVPILWQQSFSNTKQ